MRLSSDIFLRCSQCGKLNHISRHELDVTAYDAGEFEMGPRTLYEVSEECNCIFCQNNIYIKITGSEYPQGAFDGSDAEVTGATFLVEPSFEIDSEPDIPQADEKTLLDTVVDRCHECYQNAQRNHPCSLLECTHNCEHILQGDECNCINCLEEIHYHKQYGRKTYDCPNLVLCYGCRYLNRFTSEIRYALDVVPVIETFDEYRILSIGCGPAPDLMAFEKYIHEKNLNKRILYKGFDLNENWWSIHNMISQNCISPWPIKPKFHYVDAIALFSNQQIPDANVLVLQYVISHFHNTKQFDQLHTFFEHITDNIILKMKKPSVIIIHDVNHFQLGRDHFEDLIEILRTKGVHGVCQKRYFDNAITHQEQRFGYAYPSISLHYPPKQEIRDIYCRSNNDCSGASLIIELRE